jgi:hypothetical protein
MRREMSMSRGIRLPQLAAALAIGFALAAGRPGHASPPESPVPTPRPAPDPLARALQERITGKKPLDEVRIDFDWSVASQPVSVRLWGDGIGIWEERKQFLLTREQVIEALKALRDGRFGSLPGYFGSDMEGEADSPVRLKGQVTLHIGPQVKRVAQLGDGEQSAGLETIAQKLLAICTGPAAKGKTASSLAEGLRLIDQKALSPRVLSVLVQRGKGSGERWILRVEGRTATNREIRTGAEAPVPRRWTLPEANFRALVTALAEAQVDQLPVNLYAPVYTDLRVRLLDHSRTVTARDFLDVTPETHGSKQEAFDRLFASLEALHAKTAKEGKKYEEVQVISQSDRERKEEKEREREEERDREKEKKERTKAPVPERRNPTPSPKP